MQEAAHRGSADRTLVSLHPHNLRAIDTKTHVSAWQDDGVLVGGVADDTFLLTFIGQVGSIVIYSINVIQIHNLVVV